MDMEIPPPRIKIMLESDPLKSIMLVRKLAALGASPGARHGDPLVLVEGHALDRPGVDPVLDVRVVYACDQLNRNPRPQLEPQITSLEQFKINEIILGTPVY